MEVVLTEYVPITDSQFGRRGPATRLLVADRLGFDEVRGGEFALLITEVARNVLSHGRGGQAIIAGHEERTRPGGAAFWPG